MARVNPRAAEFLDVLSLKAQIDAAIFLQSEEYLKVFLLYVPCLNTVRARPVGLLNFSRDVSALQ